MLNSSQTTAKLCHKVNTVRTLPSPSPNTGHHCCVSPRTPDGATILLSLLSCYTCPRMGSLEFLFIGSQAPNFQSREEFLIRSALGVGILLSSKSQEPDSRKQALPPSNGHFWTFLKCRKGLQTFKKDGC